MDMIAVLAFLRAEQVRIAEAIAALERVKPVPSEPMRRRRGRRYMTAEERQEVSNRMRQYWNARRQAAPSPEQVTQEVGGNA